jgi:hypothetical protein
MKVCVYVYVCLLMGEINVYVSEVKFISYVVE